MVPGTVKDQITLYDSEVTDEDVIEAAKTAGLHDAIMELEKGYDTICKPEDFSQGQWQFIVNCKGCSSKAKIASA